MSLMLGAKLLRNILKGVLFVFSAREKPDRAMRSGFLLSRRKEIRLLRRLFAAFRSGVLRAEAGSCASINRFLQSGSSGRHGKGGRWRYAPDPLGEMSVRICRLWRLMDHRLIHPVFLSSGYGRYSGHGGHDRVWGCADTGRLCLVFPIV